MAGWYILLTCFQESRLYTHDYAFTQTVLFRISEDSDTDLSPMSPKLQLRISAVCGCLQLQEWDAEKRGRQMKGRTWLHKWHCRGYDRIRYYIDLMAIYLNCHAWNLVQGCGLGKAPTMLYSSHTACNLDNAYNARGQWLENPSSSLQNYGWMLLNIVDYEQKPPGVAERPWHPSNMGCSCCSFWMA